MIGSSVVPGLPNRCVMPSSFNKARKAERPVMRFFIRLLQPAGCWPFGAGRSCPISNDPRNGARSWLPCVAKYAPAFEGRLVPRPAQGLDRGPLSCNQSVTHCCPSLQIMSRIRAKTDAFRAIADPTRRAILDRLRAGPANAGTLAADFPSSRPAAFKHLPVLREARLVVDTKMGRERVYAVNPVPLQSVAGWLEGYRAFWQANLMRLKRNLEAK